MKAYSQDLRTRVVQAIDRKVGTQSEVAAFFGVSRTFVKKLLRLRREAGCFDPKPHRGGHVPMMTNETLELLRRRVTERPEATLEDLRRHLAEQTGMQISTATVCRALQKLGLPRAGARHRAHATTATRISNALQRETHVASGAERHSKSESS